MTNERGDEYVTRLAVFIAAIFSIACGSSVEKGAKTPASRGPSAIASRQSDSPSLPPAASNERPEILAIRALYRRINQLVPTCQMHEDDLSGFSLEGGVLRSYRCGDSIPKIVAWYYGETYRNHEEYYLENGRPAFVYTAFERYAGTFGRVIHTDESRFYFAHDRLVRWIDSSGTNVPIESERARARADSVLKEADQVVRRALGDTTALVPRGG